MHFNTKSYLKSIRNHTTKHAQKLGTEFFSNHLTGRARVCVRSMHTLFGKKCYMSPLEHILTFRGLRICLFFVLKIFLKMLIFLCLK